MEGERSHSPQCSLQVDMYCTGLCVCVRIVSAFTHYAFIFAYFLMLSSHSYYACEVILKLCCKLF